jgi:hypothetical protein
MTPIANLMVSVQHLFGVDSESYGVDQCASNGDVALV